MFYSCSDNRVDTVDTKDGPSELAWEAWQNPHGYTYRFNAIWGRSATDVYIVGGYGLILHYDGRDWEFLHHDGVTVLNDVWGISARDVIAVCAAGTIIHYDGS
jgi:hypothetical protein